jgi:hypothetical protein
MDATPLLSTFVLLAATLTVLPGATAELPTPTDIPYCVTACGPGEPAASALSCKPVDRYDGGIHTTVSSDCRTQVDIKTYDCVWNCGWHDVVRTHYLTIRQYGQDNGEASMSAAAIGLPSPCGPTALCQGPECPATSVTTTDLFAYLGPHATVSVSPDCKATVEERGLRCAIGTAEVGRTVGPLTVGADVCMPGLDCTCDPVLSPMAASSSTTACPAERLEGTWFSVEATASCRVEAFVSDPVCHRLADFRRQAVTPVQAGPAEVHATACLPVTDCFCDPMEASGASTSSAAIDPFPTCVRECTPPIVPDGCDLRALTPASTPVGWLDPQDRVWGADCTADVEPGYECAGGWGFDRDVTAAFVQVTARVCTGGPFPPPVVQAILDALQLE